MDPHCLVGATFTFHSPLSFLVKQMCFAPAVIQTCSFPEDASLRVTESRWLHGEEVSWGETLKSLVLIKGPLPLKFVARVVFSGPRVQDQPARRASKGQTDALKLFTNQPYLSQTVSPACRGPEATLQTSIWLDLEVEPMSLHNILFRTKTKPLRSVFASEKLPTSYLNWPFWVTFHDLTGTFK